MAKPYPQARQSMNQAEPQAFLATTTPIIAEVGLPPIEPEPTSWKDLERACARLLGEAGYMDVTVGKHLELARGSSIVDVYAVNPETPPARICVECKYWSTAVPKAVVHAFRTVVADAGLHLGVVVSRAGFQRGAYEAAALSNVLLVDWQGFQNLFVERWFSNFAVPAGRAAAEPLVDYTEPFNSRVQQKADRLPSSKFHRFLELRDQYRDLGNGLLILWWSGALRHEGNLPSLPLRDAFKAMDVDLPDEILSATNLRALLVAASAAYEEAVAAFDEVFGERA